MIRCDRGTHARNRRATLQTDAPNAVPITALQVRANNMRVQPHTEDRVAVQDLLPIFPFLPQPPALFSQCRAILNHSSGP
jgi:hypothetical protein